MTEERINELEEYEQNSPKVNNREKTGPHPKKKKLNRTLAICRKIKKKKKRIITIPDGEKKRERVSEEIRPEIPPNLVKG